MSMVEGQPPGAWGPDSSFGRSRRLLRRVSETVAAVLLLAIVMLSTSGVAFVRTAEANLRRVTVASLVAPTSDARTFLVVGSDDRSGLSAAERQQYRLGSFTGRRSDVIIHVSISEDRDSVTLVSLPRDLVVFDAQGRPSKLTDNYAGGPEALVDAIERTLGLTTNNFIEVSLNGFIEIVRTLGSVEVCFQRPLVDPKSGADFEADTCYDMGPAEALSFVRSREGSRADFERIERQQLFIRAVLREVTSARTLADPRRVSQLIEDGSRNVTTDDGLTLDQMRSLGLEMVGVVRDGVPMITLPSYPQRYQGVWYVVPYGPGTRALIEDLRAGRAPLDRGTAEVRRTIGVQVLSGGRGREAFIVLSTLRFAGFGVETGGPGPVLLDAGTTTTVHYVPGAEVAAGYVAATLGADLLPLPASIALPEGIQVVVAVGDDAAQ
jgi:LCP family protein required for cell wall assembly